LKFRTFQILLTLVGVAVILGVFAFEFVKRKNAPPQKINIVEVPSGTAPVAQPPTTPPTTPAAVASADAGSALPEGAFAFRDVDHDVLRLVQQPAAQDHLKDVTKGKPYKVDLYSDDSKQWRRVKIDLNRNGKWDEKWSLKDGKWRREVSNADDENYDESFVLVNGAWVKQ
jgi:hypothetical protein